MTINHNSKKGHIFQSLNTVPNLLPTLSRKQLGIYDKCFFFTYSKCNHVKLTVICTLFSFIVFWGVIQNDWHGQIYF